MIFRKQIYQQEITRNFHNSSLLIKSEQIPVISKYKSKISDKNVVTGKVLKIFFRQIESLVKVSHSMFLIDFFRFRLILIGNFIFRCSILSSCLVMKRIVKFRALGGYYVFTSAIVWWRCKNCNNYFDEGASKSLHGLCH